MAIDVSLHHLTHYKYDRPIELGPQIIRLRPAPHTRSPIHKYSLDVEPKKHFLNWQQDPFGNYLARFVFEEPVKEFKVNVGLVTEIRSFNPFEFFLEENCEHFPFSYDSQLVSQLKPYLELIEQGQGLLEVVNGISKDKVRTVDFLVSVNQILYQRLNYLVRLEPGVQTCEETLNKNSGSCRDFAWLLCMIMRHLGIASRFVSGYLIQLKADVKSIDGPSGTKEDFTDLHAWCEVYVPGAGWIGLDATSGLLAGEGHIPLCCTPSPIDAAPITGVIETCEAELIHEMSVTRLNQDRRITNPYTKEEWEKIVETGQLVDKKLEEEDVRLTMGGEPTFVPFDNIKSESWSGKALGEEKWKQSYQFFNKIKNEYAPSGFVHMGQGKWYPGEELPRWSMSCYWRADQQKICNLSSTEEKGKPSKKDLNSFAYDLTRLLGLSEEMLLSVFGERLKQEGDSKGSSATGFVLPLLFSHTLKRWISSPWGLKEEDQTLISGDSPLGFRLPLNKLPKNKEGLKEIWPERDPFEELDPLVSYELLKEKILGRETSKALPKKVLTDGYVRTALCLEIRKDKIQVFMPPLNYIEHYLELIIAVEMIASKHNLNFSFEGYRPPSDQRIKSFSITPDPGVIEVNVCPVSSWDEFLRFNSFLYQTAHESKLSTSRYFLDGRRVGTGGGNHIVLGAKRPSESPFLRKPHLLKSMLTFWQHHPSLSYLFASEFIGPTSQAPRIDEARHDSLYELEIAFSRVSEKEDLPFWEVDRLFRNLLIDSSGNTHRTEFCIDKLYSPDSETGRLGLLELRGFEMPPHPQMAAVQALLIRSAVSKFWKNPLDQNLIRWGTKLHDRFMLPYYLWADLLEVLEELKTKSVNFDPLWFKAFLDFRCPVWGSTKIKGIDLEIRHALEPWHVMGEETYQGAVSRAVDSSVERIQIKVNGFDERYSVLCNNYLVPLEKGQKEGEYLAGIRFKAWQPSSGLHPKIPVHSPLRIEIIRNSDSYSIGGCTYHVVHPGGQNYDKVPINENEAESRCRARFDITGHSSGKVKVKQRRLNREYPCTLDLRYV